MAVMSLVNKQLSSKYNFSVAIPTQHKPPWVPVYWTAIVYYFRIIEQRHLVQGYFLLVDVVDAVIVINSAHVQPVHSPSFTPLTLKATFVHFCLRKRYSTFCYFVAA